MATQDDNAKAPVIVAAKSLHLNANDPIRLSTGVQARIKSVSATLIDSVTSRIKDPAVPKIFMEEKNREIANPDDPDYQAALQEAGRQRGIAALDAIIMFGVELVDPVPPHLDADGKPADWFKKLKYLEKHGSLSLEEYDMEDDMEREFVYKRFVAVSPQDIDRLNKMNRVTDDEVRRAEDSFRR